MSYNYAADRQLVSAEAFCAKIDSLISAFGGTPTDVELSPSAMKSEANFRHQVTDELFQAKINQLVTAMGGTPSAIVPTSGNGYAATHGYVDLATFGDKLDEIAENAGGGGGALQTASLEVRVGNNVSAPLADAGAIQYLAVVDGAATLKTVNLYNTTMQFDDVLIVDGVSSLVKFVSPIGYIKSVTGTGVEFFKGNTTYASFAGVQITDATAPTTYWSLYDKP